MNDQGFEELMESVRWMGRHMRGEEVDGWITHIPDPDVPDVKAIRDKTGQ
jgi:putative transcriptional regulator